MGKHQLTACVWLLATACGRTELPLSVADDAGAAPNAVAVRVEPALACVAQASRVGVRVSVTRGSSSPAADLVVTADGAREGVSVEPLTIPASQSSGLLWIDVAYGTLSGTVTLTVRAGEVSSTLDLTVGGAPFGSVDGTFAHDGLPVSTPNVLVAVQGDSILAGMTTAIPPDDLTGAKTWLVRIGPDFRLDPGFGAPPGVAAVDTSVTSLATTHDGSVMLGTALGWSTSQSCSHVRGLTRDGAPMQVLASPAADCGEATTATVLEAPDQAIYGCGSLWNCCGFAERYRGSSFDASFGNGGAVGYEPYVNSLHACALGPDGHLVMALFEGVEAVDETGALVFDSANHSLQYTAASFSAVAIADDGTIYVAGTSGAKSIVRALSPDGSLDPTFAAGGEAVIAGTPVSLIARQDGLVVLTDIGLMRMSFDGSTRTIATFAHGTVAMAEDACGRVVTATYDFDGVVPAVTVRRYWP